MKIKDYNDAMEFFRTNDYQAADGAWSEFYESEVLEPRIMDLAEGGPLVGTPTKEVTQFDRRIYKTPEGERVSEKSATLFLNGKWINIPSIHDGRSFTEDQLRSMIKKGIIEPTSIHGSRNEAESAAMQRSDMMKHRTKGFAGGQLVTPSVDGSRPGYGGGFIKKTLMSLIETGQTKFKDMSALKNKIKEITGKKPGGSFSKSQVDYKPLLEKFTFEKYVPKKPKQITGITKISDELADKIKNVNIKGINVSPDTTKAGQKSIKVTIQDPQVSGEFFGKNKTRVFPATEEGFAEVQKLVNNIFTSNIYTIRVQPFKTQEYFRKLRRLKEARYNEQDPFRIYKALQEYKTEKFPGSMSSDIEIQHGQPKFTTQTLSRWGLIPKEVNVLPSVKKVERLRNELLSQALVKLKNPNHSIADKEKIIGEFNNAMRGLRGQLKGTEGQGLVNFELLKLDEAGSVAKLKDVGFNPKKGLAYGDKLGELDFAKITKEQADQIIALGKKKIDLDLLRQVLPSKLKNIVDPLSSGGRVASKGGRVPLASGGWLVSLLGPEAVVLEYIFYKASKNNYESQGYSEEEAKAMAIDEVTFGITNKGDAAYNKELKKVAKEMGIGSKAFDTIREISDRTLKGTKQQERDKELLDSGYFQTEKAKNEFLASREKLYTTYDKETEKLWRKTKTEIGMDKAGEVFPTPNLDQISMESMNVKDADIHTAFGDLQKVATEKLKRRKEKAFPTQSKQVNTDQGWLGNVLTNNLWNLQSIPRTVKTAYDLINPFSPLPKLDDLKSDAALEQSKMDKMSDEELYEYNKKRNITKEDPITEESLEEIRYRYPELHLREGGIASLKRK